MPDRIAEHYERHAHAFDEARRRNFVEQGWLDRFLLAVPKGDKSSTWAAARASRSHAT